jgi:signal peptidase I
MTGLRRTRCGAVLLGWVAVAFAGVLMLTVAGSLLVGDRAVLVLSGSMEPAFSAGDLLIERGVEPSEVEIGQIVTFRDPRADRSITHRVRRVETRGSRLVFTTKGDADNSVQRWAIAADGELGQPEWTVPAIGHVAMLARTPLGLIAIVILPLLALAGWEILRIWRPRQERPEIALEARGGRA